MHNLSYIDEITLRNNNISITEELLNKIASGYPIAYIVGNSNFYGFEFIINENVLIPRFETELLVEKTIKKINYPISKIADLCSGSGVIGITLSKLLDCQVDLFDISRKANDVCQKNIDLLKVNASNFTKDILNEDINDEYEVIISNPPYLKETDNVNPNTRFEPPIALYAGDDEIIFYKRIINMVKDFKKLKLIAFEIGEEQQEIIISYANQCGFNKAYMEKDYNNCKRFIFIER